MPFSRTSYFFFLFAFLFAQSAFAQEPTNSEAETKKRYEERIAKSRILGVYIPKDENDAMKELDRLIDESSKAKLKAHTEQEAMKKLHFSFGLWMITNWSFYEGSRLSAYMRQNGVSYPDDMAEILIACYHRHLNGTSLRFSELCAQYKASRDKEFQKNIEKNQIKSLGKVPKDSLRKE
ncbi:MAG: DUF6794 domain-containing protein [Saprospiraceae bacterium]